VCGGDLNSAEGMDAVPSFAGGNQRLRKNWEEAGSHDLRRGFFEEGQQTFFRPTSEPWQINYVFADAETAQLAASLQEPPSLLRVTSRHYRI
jgi:hypothetical protein